MLLSTTDLPVAASLGFPYARLCPLLQSLASLLELLTEVDLDHDLDCEVGQVRHSHSHTHRAKGEPSPCLQHILPDLNLMYSVKQNYCNIPHHDTHLSYHTLFSKTILCYFKPLTCFFPTPVTCLSSYPKTSQSSNVSINHMVAKTLRPVVAVSWGSQLRQEMRVPAVCARAKPELQGG